LKDIGKSISTGNIGRQGKSLDPGKAAKSSYGKKRRKDFIQEKGTSSSGHGKRGSAQLSRRKSWKNRLPEKRALTQSFWGRRKKKR